MNASMVLSRRSATSGRRGKPWSSHRRGSAADRETGIRTRFGKRGFWSRLRSDAGARRRTEGQSEHIRATKRPGSNRLDPLPAPSIPSRLSEQRLPQSRRIDEGPFCCNDHPGVVGGRKQVWASPTPSCAAQVFAVGTAAREGTIDLYALLKTTSFRTRQTCARRDPARDFDGWRCVNTVQ
jgi:hypothetical protein